MVSEEKRPLRKKARIDAEINLETAQEGDSSLASLGPIVAEEQVLKDLPRMLLQYL